MTLQEFTSSLTASTPPNVSALLKAMWFDAHGDWDTAHHVAQDVATNDGSWVHAYLHRKEGDESNASYWYHRAQKPHCRKPLDDEWKEIVTALLQQS